MGAVGIERIGIWPGTMMLDIATLCAARGADWAAISRTLDTVERSICPPWEDTVTMSVNAARGLLSEEEMATVELLITPTESSVDQEKPVSSWVHRWLGTPSHCRNFEVKHACYGGTAAMRMAEAWLASREPPARALIVGADQSLLGFRGPQEYVMGACGFAIVLSHQPDLLELEPHAYGVYAHEVSDLIRPTPTVDTGDSDTSLLAYLEALAGAWEDFDRRTGGLTDFDADFARYIYHLPFAGMGQQAHRTLASISLGLDRRTARAQFADKVEPSVRHSRRIGSSYSASPLIALLSLLDHDPAVAPGDRISIFSYGSGSCAEFYTGRIGAQARKLADQAALGARLDARRAVTVNAYESSELNRISGIGARGFNPDRSIGAEWYAEGYDGKGFLVLDRIDDYIRDYKLS